MKRLIIWGIAAFVGLIIFPAAIIGGPAGPPSGLDVTVVNPLPLPVTGDIGATVTGDVNVTNTPDVNVANDPVVKAQQDGEWSINIVQPILEAVQASGDVSEEAGGSWTDIYTVPGDKMLVIEYVSVYVFGTDIHVFECFVQTMMEASQRHMINPPTIRAAGQELMDGAVASGGQTTQIYAAPGTTVSAYVGAFDKDDTSTWIGSAKISGRLIPLE